MKNKYRFLSLILASALASAMLTGCGSSSDVASETQLSASGASFADSSDSSLPTDSADLVSNWSVDTAETELDSILSSDLTDKKVVLDAPEILQNPELPTGCESVALTIALNSLGCDLEKTEIADKYLEYGDNLAYQYAGDPHTDSGAGVFAGGIVNTAEKYIKEKKLDIAAINTSGTSLLDLCKVVAAGYPVVIWGTMYMSDPMISSQSYEYDGHTYTWYKNEHCMVLTGFDLDSGTVVISDPLSGIVVRDAKAFESLFNETGMYSVVLMNANGVSKTDRDTSAADSNSKGGSGSTAPDNMEDIISNRQNTSDYYYNQYQSYGSQSGGTYYEANPSASWGTSSGTDAASSNGSSSSSANSESASGADGQQSSENSGAGGQVTPTDPASDNAGTNTETDAGTGGASDGAGGASPETDGSASDGTGGGASTDTGSVFSDTGTTEGNGAAAGTAPSSDTLAITGNAAD